MDIIDITIAVIIIFYNEDISSYFNIQESVYSTYRLENANDVSIFLTSAFQATGSFYLCSELSTIVFN